MVPATAVIPYGIITLSKNREALLQKGRIIGSRA